MFMIYKNDNFQTFKDNEKTESIIKRLSNKLYYLYVTTAKRLGFVDFGNKSEKLDKIKEMIKKFLKSNSNTNYKHNSQCLNENVKSSESDEFNLKNLQDMINFYEEKVDQINEITAKVDKEELFSCDKDFDAILNNFNIDLKKFMKHGEELQNLLNEIVSVLELFKTCLLVLNQKDCKLKEAKDFTKYLILQIKNKISFHKLYDFYESDKVLKMLYEVEKKLVKNFNNLVSNDFLNN
ncbi:hypothetical protein A0H76_2585 [Hepatospora eriocheir]|uniref:Uncharacterized protein n=1 Tax=Hepatospora eriocheir TaxID=1081669 RepID=A0A1X0QJN7_9MICR|nr:hypothetical protein A0H76_2585 [Hepatospora eriocheir]